MFRATIPWLIGLSLLAGSCASRSQVTARWQNPNVEPRRFEKLAVVAISGDREIRRLFENHVIARLRERGIPALAGNELFHEVPTKSEIEAVRTRFRELKVDGAITLRLISRRTREKTVAPLTDFGGNSSGFYGYYGYVYEPVSREGSVEVDATYVIEAGLHVLDSDDSVAAVEVTVKNPRNIEDVRDVTRLVVESFDQAGLLRGPTTPAN